MNSLFTSWAKLRNFKISSFFLVVFCKNLGFFSNLQISVVFITFLHIINILLLKYDMRIFVPGNLSGFRIFSRFLQIFFKSSDFSWLNDNILIKFDMMVFFPGNYLVSGFFWIFFQFSDFDGLNHISLNNW